MPNQDSRPTLPTADGTRSLARAVGLLRALSTHAPTGWRLTDLAHETGLDHSTAHRILGFLVQQRLATRVDGSKRYALGGLAYELGLAAAPYYALDRPASAVLARLAADTRDIVFMNVRSGPESVCIARHEGRNALKAYTVEVGTRRPLGLSAGGIAILISLPRDERAAIVATNLESLKRRGQARQKAMKRMLTRSRRLGFALNLEDIIPGISALGVPIRSNDGAPVASISLATTATALTEARRAVLLERLQAAAAKIEPMLEDLRL